MKHLLILLISILLLSSPVIGQETGVLYQYETSTGITWKTFGDGKVQPKYKGEIKNRKMDGLGVLTYPYDGKSIVGEWKNGKEWNTKHRNKDGTLIGFYENGKKSEKKQWTKQLGTSEGDSGEGVTTDSSGNIYVTGTTDGGLDGRTGSFLVDIFLIKYNSSGTKQWTKQLGSSDDGNYGQGVTTDPSGNIYVTGYTFGGLDGNTSSGKEDIILVKYNSSGTKLWTKQLGTSSTDKGEEVTSDSSGNIYITGYTEGGLDGDTNSGYTDIFLIKYNSSGIKQWTKQLGTSDLDVGKSVTTDSSGNIYVTGWTTGGLDGNIYSGGSDIFLIKFNSSGTKQWTRQLGSSLDDVGLGVTVDSSNNLYVTGYTSGGLDGNTNSGSYDIFLVKYNSSGTKQWTKQLGTSDGNYGQGVTTDSSGNIYVTGYTYGGLDGNKHLGWYDIILVKYSSSGTKLWTNQMGSSSTDKGQGVTTDSSGNIYVTGYTYGGLDGNINNGSTDIFLIKFNSSGTK